METKRARLFLDANILFAAQLRALLLALAENGTIDVHWSDDVQREWAEALAAKRPELAASIVRAQAAMADAFPEAAVQNYKHRVAQFELPDPDDRHVVAAAASAACPIILTFNLRDFPDAALTPHGLIAMHPDTFLAGLMSADAKSLVFAAATARDLLKNPAIAPDRYLANLARLGLEKTALLLAAYQDAI
ncbi:PIN domain-containing protein [Hyphomicrobium zavarzinii]|uniref:PIN domain-containing protein n=1 Tax=Hyphomicrobium zavarzinii TaxID=48292 RepID=UPI002352AEBC|nr:PIN domain-containing protein [Hyphomicrobium zavarzinii]